MTSAVVSVAIVVMPGFLFKVQADTLPVAVIISREIKPFIEMVEGLESAIDQPVVRIFIDQNSNPFSHDPLYKGTQIDNYSFVIAVGPSALSYIIQNNKLDYDTISGSDHIDINTNEPAPDSEMVKVRATSSLQEEVQTGNHPPQNELINKENSNTGSFIRNNKYPSKENTQTSNNNSNINSKILYAMVLNPETIIPPGVSLCGISLNLFSKDTVSKITMILPSIKKMGILFDPDNNSEWFERAKDMGIFNGIQTVPLYIKEQHDVNRLHQENSDIDALLFIPDKTVTSPTIINHIIKQSIARRIPVIGYNSFFQKSGAALSFILDYRAIGKQMAQKIISLSRGGLCEPSIPAHHMTLSRSVVELLGLEIGSSLPLELKVEP